MPDVFNGSSYTLFYNTTRGSCIFGIALSTNLISVCGKQSHRRASPSRNLKSRRRYTGYGRCAGFRFGGGEQLHYACAGQYDRSEWYNLDECDELWQCVSCIHQSHDSQAAQQGDKCGGNCGRCRGRSRRPVDTRRPSLVLLFPQEASVQTGETGPRRLEWRRQPAGPRWRRGRAFPQ